jgi:AraC-like DNA-binding protein
LDAHLGTGSIQVCFIEKNLAVSFQDFRYRKDREIVRPEREGFDIIFSAGEKNLVSSYIRKNGSAEGYVPAGFTSHCISISLLPEFFTDFLCSRYRIEPEQFARALHALNESPPPVELTIILKQIGAALKSGNYSRLYYEGKTLELISVILDWHTRRQAVFPNGPALYDRNGIAKAIAYITSHYGDKISLGVLAKIAAMSVSKFTFVFKSLTGFSAACYIRRIRMDKGMELIKNTSEPIGDIAGMVGYKHHSRFSAIFREHFGLVPEEFRKTNI